MLASKDVCTGVKTYLWVQEPFKLEQGFLADLAVARQLFAFWLPEMCHANSTSSALYQQITEAAHAQGSLLSLIGYFPDQEVNDVQISAKTRPKCSQS